MNCIERSIYLWLDSVMNFLFITLQILAQHIKAVLPGLRAQISTNLVYVVKEHQSYGHITESKACVNTRICFAYVPMTC
jgi:predicted thioesterase